MATTSRKQNRHEPRATGEPKVTNTLWGEHRSTGITCANRVHRLPDRFITDDHAPVTIERAGTIHRNHLIGEESNQQFGNTAHQRARKWQRKIFDTDRHCRDTYDNCYTAMLSLRPSPTIGGEWLPPTYIARQVAATVDNVIARLRAHIPHSFEWVAVLAANSRGRTPHLHILCWIDGPVTWRNALDTFEPAVDSFIRNCDLADADHNATRDADGNLIEGTVTLRSPEERDTRPITDACGKHGATTRVSSYVARQIPNSQPPREMTQPEAEAGAIASAFNHVTGRRSIRASAGVKIRDKYDGTPCANSTVLSIGRFTCIRPSGPPTAKATDW